MDGRKVTRLDELLDGQSYVCSGKGESFKRIDYTMAAAPQVIADRLKRRCKARTSAEPQPRIAPPPDCVRPRIITLIRNGLKPRKIVRVLLNKRNSVSLEQVLSALTEAARLDSGAVRRVFTLSGRPATELQHFFQDDDVFFVYGNERHSPDDFELEFEESKAIQQYKKPPTLRNG